MAGTHLANHYLSRRPMVLGLSKMLFLCLSQLPFAQAMPIHLASLWTQAETGESTSNPSLWLDLALAVFLTLSGGVFAGLTIALMGQDEIYLQVIRDSGEGKEVKHATKVLNLLNRGKHWVLVTLLLSNVITNETLPIVIDKSLGGGWPAVVSSTALVVIFGEVVPQSICVRYGMPIGAAMAPVVLVMMYILSPIAWPTAKLLDYLLGDDHGTTYKKAGLKTLVSLHRNLGDSAQRLHADEVTIISAVLDLKEKSIGSIMTPMDDVFTLSLDDVLNETTMDDILSQGYSRIPVHHPDNEENFMGMLLVKMLITYDPEDAKPVRDFALATLPETSPETSCLDIVNFFQEGKSHMVLVSGSPGKDHGALGVVTLEDVIEELIGEEIIDESDVFIDVHKAIRRMAPAPRNKYPRMSFVAPTPKASNAELLIDISENEPLDAKQLVRTQTGEDGQLKDGRRVSASSILGPTRNSRTNNINESVKEQLKHLGPSNLASRPKTTRYTSVKIKPGSEATTSTGRARSLDVKAESRQRPQRRISETASDYAGGIGEGVLPSGGKSASDGVQAVAHGYGAISSSSNEQRPTSTHRKSSDLSERDHSSPKERSHLLRPGMSKNKSHDTIGELPERDHSRSPIYQSLGPARSGSITENIIDANGVRKVVLEMSSSSDTSADDAQSAKKGTSNKSSNEDVANTKSGGNNENSHVGAGRPASSKKKRGRRKKGKSDDSDSYLC